MDTGDSKPVDLEDAHRRSATEPPPEEYANPPGLGEEKHTAAVDADSEPCADSAIEDLVLEESKPGYGIAGYEGEEVGGG